MADALHAHAWRVVREVKAHCVPSDTVKTASAVCRAFGRVSCKPVEGKHVRVTLRMLVAIDESEASGRVTDFVNRFFAASDVEVLALNVARTPLPLYPGVSFGMVSPYIWSGVDPTGLRGSPEELAKDAVTRGERLIDARGIAEDNAFVELGEPVETILKVTEEQNVDLVVVGTTNKSWWERLLQGSVSDELVHKGPRPVLVVR